MSLSVAEACLVRATVTTQIRRVAHPHFDFSHLSPEERLQLVEDLWDSLAVGAPESVPIPESHARELDRRMAALREDGESGRPWREALDAIDEGLTGRGG